MKPRTVLAGIIVLVAGILLPMLLSAQRGNIIIPTGASISVPTGAMICADTIFANNPGYGRLNIADPTCLCSGAVVIPIELLTLSATLQNDVVILSWTTATETRNFGFEVQRKAGQKDWSAIGFVEGNGSTTETHSYAFTDDPGDLPSSCRALRYRLKQLDLDGGDAYSPEVEVHLDAPLPRFALEGFPSPCDDQLTVKLSLAEAGATSIRLHDIAGRVVMIIAQDALLPAGSHSLMVRTSDVPSGLYLLVVEKREGRRIEKVVVRH
jgi:hypothetical protein